MTSNADASSKTAWPPIIYASCVLIATLLTHLRLLPFLNGDAALPLRLLGIALVMVGLTIGMAGIAGFRRAGTAIPPTRPTTAIVVEGIYRYTRNPMYLGFTVILAALALAANSLWFVILAPAAAIAVTKLAIEREERYLETKFGEPYLAYRARVRRWL